MIHQEEVDETDPVISALASNRWQTDTGDFGALINLSYSKTSYRDQTATSGAQLPYIKNGRDLPNDPSVTDPETGDVVDQRYLPMQRIYPTRPGVSQNPIWQAGLDNGLPTEAGSTLDINDGSAEYVMARDALILPDFTGERERPNANISLQFSPNDDSEYYFEALYNGSHNRLHNLMYFAFVDGWESLSDISENVEDTYELYPGTNVVRERMVRNTDVFTSGDFTETKSNSYVYALGGEWNLSENFDVRSELVYQESDYEREFFGMRANDQHWQATTNFDGVPGLTFADNPETPDVDESNLTDPSLYTMGAIYDNADEETGSGVTFTADAEYWTQSDLFPKIEFGVRWDDRDASISRRDQDSEEMGCEARQPTEGYTPACDFSTYDGLQKINEGYLEGHANVPRGWMSADSSYVSANRELFRELYNMELNPQFRKTFEADERNAALYAKVRFEADLMGRTLDGEVGGRYVDVLTETVFYDQQSGMASEGETTTSEFLPSAQLRYHLTDDWLVRFSYSEALRMPGFNDLNPTITYNSDLSNVGYGTASGGNENLKPTTSENLDLSLEWYFGDASYTYVTLFERKVEGLVIPFRSSIQADVEGVNVDTFILDRPENASNGVLRGAELGLTYFPENLPAALDGLGMVASATFLDSEQDIPVPDEQANQVDTRTEPFFGVSDSSYSVTLAYERPTFDARLSYIWREDAINRNDAGALWQ
ncbi:TonB-dependent receptor [Marinimicrobium sp. ARAG 43.8]|uniref:TonB-dependent receptor n=1 Tax=Marinimicrobium sp. ARAG 43.8 TaxID=3418719 RepID=UPI003CEB1472